MRIIRALYLTTLTTDFKAYSTLNVVFLMFY